MHTDEHGLKHSALTERIIGVFYDVYNELESGFLESIHVEALALALKQARLRWSAKCHWQFVFEGGLLGDFERTWL
jgi:GxxExxY protein